MTFNNVNTCPLKISLFGVTTRSTQLVNVGWCKSLTVAFGSSVVQFMTILKPSNAGNAGAGGLRNFSASTPAEKQMIISTCTNSVMRIRGWGSVKIFQLFKSFSAYNPNVDMTEDILIKQGHSKKCVIF